MERAQVADFYRGKGYQVHESIVVTGQSGNAQRVPLLCEGPLGNLTVFFGDAAGVDGPEIGAAKRVARDLGATAVVAAGAFTGEQRRTAAELGVVLLDADAVAAPLPAQVTSAWPGQARSDRLGRDLEAHPWPASGRPGGEGAPASGGAAAVFDIDDVLAEPTPGAPAPGPGLAPTPTPTVLAQSPAQPHALPAAPAVRVRSDDGGLWQHGRRAPTVQTAAPRAASAPTAAPVSTAAPASTASAASAGRFAWLDLPKPAPGPVEVEATSSVMARASAPPVVPLTPEQAAAQRRADLLRQAQLRLLVRRGAWILAAAALAYLFLLWWF